MKIVVDINHPAHVHYFKNFIWKMKEKGHEILITASEKDISYRLLDLYGFEFIKIGNYGKSTLRKMVNVPILDIKMFQAVRKFEPDVFLGFGSIRAAHVSTLLRKPYIALDDSEPSPFEHLLYVPFADAILTPTSFRKDFGKKHKKYNGYIELAYLHPRYFKPDPSCLNIIGEDETSKFVLLRFVAWEAVHDVTKAGFSLEDKIRLVKALEKYAHVFITSETPLPQELASYQIKISPEKIHHILNYAYLFVGDSQTMTTESALLGTPAIRCNTFVGKHDMGNFVELENTFGLIFNYNNPDKAIDKALQLVSQKNITEQWQVKRRILLDDKIDVTAYMIWFVENFPRSSTMEYREQRKELSRFPPFDSSKYHADSEV